MLQQLITLIAFCWLLTVFSTPIGVVRGTTQEMHYALTAIVLSSGKPSTRSLPYLATDLSKERPRVWLHTKARMSTGLNRKNSCALATRRKNIPRRLKWCDASYEST